MTTRIAGRTASRLIRRGLPRLVLALLGCWGLYVLVVNLAFRTPLVAHLANASPHLHLSYRSAWSLWPGRIHARGLVLRLEDYNVQAELAVDDVQFDVSVHELLFRRFHAWRVRGEGATFRMRHKVHSVGNDAARLTAYPRIAGFVDPPLYVGPPPPPIPDAQYALWEVKLESVVAHVRELWILEYRFRGNGVATGAFDLRPERFFTLAPSQLDLDEGTLTVADAIVSERVRAVFTCEVVGHDVRAFDGLAILRQFNASAHGTLANGRLGFLDVYLEPNLRLTASGRADWKFDADLDRGKTRRGSRIEIRLRGASVASSRVAVNGDVDLTLSAPNERRMVLEARAESLFADSNDTDGLRGPTARDVDARLVATSDLAKTPAIERTSLVVRELRAPTLAWFRPLFASGAQAPRIGGAATGMLALERDGDSLDGRVRVELADAWIEHGPLRVDATGRVQTLITHASSERDGFGLASLSGELPRLSIRDGSDAAARLSLNLSSGELRVTELSPLDLDGNIDVHADGADSLLGLLIRPVWLRRFTANTLGVRTLDGRLGIRIGSHVRRLEVRRARTGKLGIEGYVDALGAHPRGKFLLSSELANVGVDIDDGTTHTSLLVGNDWLSEGSR